MGEGIVTGIVGISCKLDDKFSMRFSSIRGHGGGDSLLDISQMEDKLSFSPIISSREVDVGIVSEGSR